MSATIKNSHIKNSNVNLIPVRKINGVTYYDVSK